MKFHGTAKFLQVKINGIYCFVQNNLVEIRSDSLKLLTTMRRPAPKAAASIGAWLTIFQVGCFPFHYFVIISVCRHGRCSLFVLNVFNLQKSTHKSHVFELIPFLRPISDRLLWSNSLVTYIAYLNILLLQRLDYFHCSARQSFETAWWLSWCSCTMSIDHRNWHVFGFIFEELWTWEFAESGGCGNCHKLRTFGMFVRWCGEVEDWARACGNSHVRAFTAACKVWILLVCSRGMHTMYY